MWPLNNVDFFIKTSNTCFVCWTQWFNCAAIFYGARKGTFWITNAEIFFYLIWRTRNESKWPHSWKCHTWHRARKGLIKSVFPILKYIFPGGKFASASTELCGHWPAGIIVADSHPADFGASDDATTTAVTARTTTRTGPRACHAPGRGPMAVNMPGRTSAGGLGTIVVA